MDIANVGCSKYVAWVSKDKIAEALPEQLFALHDRMRGELRSLCGEIKVTDAQVGVLWRMSAEQDSELTSGQLADRIGCDASTVTSLVDRLERHGVLVRVAHPHDRRAKILRLTPLGCELRDRVEQYRRHESPFAALSPAEQERLHELLERTIDGNPQAAR
jgi:DNA-binding MarR family transcriptional regulator